MNDDNLREELKTKRNPLFEIIVMIEMGYFNYLNNSK